MIILEYLSKYAFLAPYGTLVGVAVALCQFRKNNKQQVTNFEDSLTKEYREIVRRIPYKALVGDKLSSQERVYAYNEVYNYMDLCNEQVFLRKSGRVGKATWGNWQEGMSTNFDLEVFKEASEEVFKKLDDNFEDLKRVKKALYRTDPRCWKYRDFLNCRIKCFKR